MNIATEPTAPMMKAAWQIIAKINIRASLAGLCTRFRSAIEVAGFWAIESIMMFRIKKTTKPRTDPRSRNMNFLAIRQGWANARTKAVAASKARRMPGKLSLIPTTADAIADKPQATKRIRVLNLLFRVERASIMTISFMDSGFCR